MHITCENGEVEWTGDIGKTSISYQNGKGEEFDNLIHDRWRFEGFKDLVAAINANTAPICTPEMARCHTVTVNAIHESCPNIEQIPDADILEVEDWEIFPPDTKGQFRRVRNMDEYLQQAFETKKFLSELKGSWAKNIPSPSFAIRDYNYFPQSHFG
jgi:hypothetical protein